MRRSNPWLKLSAAAWALGFEASTVIGMRMLKIAAGGPAAQREASGMISEKLAAGVALQVKAATGALGFSAPGVAAKTLAHYRRKVRANRRRLGG